MSGEEKSPDTPIPEKELVDGLCCGSDEAITDFLTRTHRPVYWMSCRLTKSVETREDWTHDVLLQILDELRGKGFMYRWPGCFWSWFRKRAYFLLLNSYNRDRTHQHRELTGEPADIELEHASSPDPWNPTADLEAVEVRASIERCIESLPRSEQRSAYSLVLFDECTYEQIAEHLEAPLNTVRSWIRRARIAVRRCMEVRLGD